MDDITNADNILLAYRNIKNNKGSTTAGVDGKTIEEYENWTQEKFITYFQTRLASYQPKPPARRQAG
ncbi:MAG: hypothetical protein FWG64_06100 [Firmicutes bacterium]|nr:hypothetical protein [Bacillota bacterium]